MLLIWVFLSQTPSQHPTCPPPWARKPQYGDVAQPGPPRSCYLDVAVTRAPLSS